MDTGNSNPSRKFGFTAMPIAPKPFVLGERPVGGDAPCFIIAELSANHGGRLDRALHSVAAAAEAGADAIKIQTYTADTITLRCDRPEFRISSGPGAGMTLHQLYQQAHTPWEWHGPIFAEAKRHGLVAFSTPFDITAVDFLESLDVPLYKIASFEMVDDELLRKVASTRKPVIMSTGMASLEEIAHAIAVLEAAGTSDIAVLKCTSSYPAPDDSMHLASIPVLAAATGKLVGLSDHSLGIAAPVVARTLGASVIEKHFTIAREPGDVDAPFSLEPTELKEMIDSVRRAERMIGSAVFGTGIVESTSKQFRRSLYAVEKIRTGEVLTEKNMRSIRPGYGLSPRFRDMVLGRRATEDIERGTPIAWHHVTR